MNARLIALLLAAASLYGQKFDPQGILPGDSPWSDGTTIVHAQDYKNIQSDIATQSFNHDSAGFGNANTGWVNLTCGALPGTIYTITAASWSSGSATYTIGGHVIAVNQLVTVAGAAPSGYNLTNLTKVTGVTGTTITVAMTANPGSWTSGGTVTVSTSPTYGTLACNSSEQIEVYNGSSWVAATTAVAAGVWHSGSGVPSSGLGSNGDMYINSSTGDVYGPKTAGAWGSIVINIEGAAGTNGATWHLSSGAPSGGTGVVNDLDLDTTTGNYYLKTGSSTWTLEGSLQGPQGVGYTARGAWSSMTTYAQGDQVSYMGALYWSLAGSNTNNTPSGSPTWWFTISAGLADPGSNGVVKRTALNTTGVATGSDLPTMVASGGSHSAGAVPDPGGSAGTKKYLREDATFVVPSCTTLTVTANSVGTVYQNTGSVNRWVLLSLNFGNASSTIQILQDGSNPPTTVIADNARGSENTAHHFLTFPVLPGNYYKVNQSAGSGTTADYWTECQ